MEKLTNNQEYVDANEYLEINYPKDGVCLICNDIEWGRYNQGKLRSEITKLSMESNWIEKKLTGTLDLRDFINLKEFDCSFNQIEDFKLPLQLEKLWCSRNKLRILDLINHSQIKELYCYGSELKKLILPNYNRIECINVSNNLLIHFEYHKLNPEILTYLNISNNYFKQTDISVFSHLINLESLIISNNQFNGSLESFKEFTRLKTLEIDNIEINQGLEYLYPSINSIKCNNFLIENILNCCKDCCKESNRSNKLQHWKENNPILIRNAKIINKLSEYEEIFNLIKESLPSEVNNLWINRNKLSFEIFYNENQPFKLWLDPKLRMIDKLRVENDKYYQSFYYYKELNYYKFNSNDF